MIACPVSGAAVGVGQVGDSLGVAAVRGVAVLGVLLGKDALLDFLDVVQGVQVVQDDQGVLPALDVLPALAVAVQPAAAVSSAYVADIASGRLVAERRTPSGWPSSSVASAFGSSGS